MELRGTTRGSGYDALTVSGQASLGGTLQITLANSFAPSLGNSFDILDASSITGAFSTINLPILGSGLVWNTGALYTTGVISVVAGVAGDYNNNGAVDAADYVLWRMGGPLANEVDNPGTVNAADATAWRARFGNPSSGSGATAGLPSSAEVPEPSSAALLLAAIIGSLIGTPRRKRRG
jgi:hypothetical protein